MFHKCSDKCLCALSQPGGKETVLYCYGEVVIERPSLRPGSSTSTKEAEDNVVLLYVAQLAALAILLTAIIRRGLVKLKKEVTRLLSILSGREVVDCDSECGSGSGRQDNSGRQQNSDMIKSSSVTDWMRYQPRTVKRSSSNLLTNHKMTSQERVEETALLNNIS